MVRFVFINGRKSQLAPAVSRLLRFLDRIGNQLM